MEWFVICTLSEWTSIIKNKLSKYMFVVVWFLAGNLSDDLTNKVFILYSICLKPSSKTNKLMWHYLMNRHILSTESKELKNPSVQNILFVVENCEINYKMHLPAKVDINKPSVLGGIQET